MKKSIENASLIIVGLIVSLGVVYWLTGDARGLQAYVEEITARQGVVLRNVDCSMVGEGMARTRAGYCEFQVSPEAFDGFKAAFELYEVNDKNYIVGFSGCAGRDLVKNPAYKEQITFRGETQVHSDNGLPRYRSDFILYRTNKITSLGEHDSRALKQVFYNKSSGRVCVDLVYRYG